MKEESMEPKKHEYQIEPPIASDAIDVGPVHLQSWIETYINPDLGVDEKWIRENIGHVVTDKGNDFRKELFKKIESGDPSLRYRVARDEQGEVVGFCMATKSQVESEPNVLDALYLLRSAQGQKLGAKMMQEAMDWLGNEKPIKLEVISYNKHAIDFYKKFGFELTGEEYVWKEPVKAAVMLRQSS